MPRDNVTIRPYPYPFKAALAICSDIDNTKSLEKFLAIQEFLNTDRCTPMGKGLALEIGNSFFPYAPNDEFAYFSSRKADRDAIEAFARVGLLDAIHSFGDGADTRAHAARALDRLKDNGCMLDTWINHSQAPSNFGASSAPGQGDIAADPVYHADLSLQYGIRFAWMGAGTSVAGNNTRYTLSSFTNILDWKHSFHTLQNLLRQIAKVSLARSGKSQYSIHRSNELFQLSRLRDGQAVFEFTRSNSFWQGVGKGDNSFGLSYVIRKKALDKLITSGGASIIYTHLGKGLPESPYFSESTISALRGLANAYASGDIYVTTTSRLLNQICNRRYLVWSYKTTSQTCDILIDGIDDPLRGKWSPTENDLQGLCFYSRFPDRTRIFIDGTEIQSVIRSPSDETGRRSVMIPRTFLSYPDRY